MVPFLNFLLLLPKLLSFILNIIRKGKITEAALCNKTIVHMKKLENWINKRRGNRFSKYYDIQKSHFQGTPAAADQILYM